MALSVNKRALMLVDKAIEEQEKLRIDVQTGPLGCTIIDAGIKAIGSYAAGRLVVEICLGGCGTALTTSMGYENLVLPSIFVETDFPAIATLGSQLAGWSIRARNYFAMGSGPARALSKKPKEIYEQIQYEDHCDSAVILLEADLLPTEEVVKTVATECGISAENLYAIVAPTSSIVGSIQTSGRIVEMGVFKLCRLGLDPKLITHACGYAPIAPVHPEPARAMGRANDVLYFGGVTFYSVSRESDDRLRAIVSRSPSCSASVYVRPFYEIFRAAEFDLYRIDPDLFAPAVVSVSNSSTGATFKAGKINLENLKQSMGIVDT